MILHPGVLALVLGSIFVFLMTLFAAAVGGVILRRWDLDSSSAYQLSLERRTFLISTVMNYALGFQALSLFLFLYVVEDIHQLFVGAMCATGSLNANPTGWYALASKIGAFFCSGIWIALNSVDQKAEDYPLIRLKYRLLFLIVPLMALDLWLLIDYFMALDPDIITSCCGSLFSESGKGVGSDLAALPVKTSMIIFYSTAGLFFLSGSGSLYAKNGWLRYAFSAAAVVFFFSSLAAIVSFVSIYVYELPTHHCPFDLIQQGYHFIGYPLYISLFGAVFFGILPGCFQPLKRKPSLQGIIAGSERRWLFQALVWGGAFVLLTTWSVISSNLIYFPHFR
ncbi:MAG: hypothetical protein KKG47_03070 [Proteobacteria bacterium]|nr:hypothetical protein [Pseudomonadota bacterium]MBU1738875.1 hypothetical protein [Pseudomonadota bacterium]